MEIVGLDYEDNGDYPDHQHMMRLMVRSLKDTVHETVAFAKLEEIVDHLVGIISYTMMLLVSSSSGKRVLNHKMKAIFRQVLRTRLLCVRVMFLQLLLKT
ncbi:hypothetical protein C5167_029561 [Papaver somniferum]|nr:hypothetical protein C5167_029561 [Papaver somniferum]